MKVFIIEDNLIDIRIMESLLEQEGVSVVFSDNTIDLNKKIKQEDPDLIILDLYLKNTNGDQIALDISRDSDLSHIPILMVSAESDIGKKINIIKNFAIDFITKPITKGDFCYKVNKYCKLGHILKMSMSLQKSYEVINA